jgi:hypothetical protein
MNAPVRIEPLGSADTGRCPCCGRVSRKIWGIWQHDADLRGSYFVHWTIGHVFEKGAHIDVVFARGDGASAADFDAVSLEYRVLDSGPGLMVVDAQEGAFSMSPYIGRTLSRSDVIGGRLATTVFAICDAVLAEDRRLGALWDSPELGDQQA